MMSERLLTQTEVGRLFDAVFEDVDSQIISLIRLHNGDKVTRKQLLYMLDVLSLVREKANARLEYRNPINRTD